MLHKLPSTVVALLALSFGARAQQFGPWYALGRFSAEFDKGSTALVLAPEKQLKSMSGDGAGPDFSATYDGGNKESVAWKKLSGAFAAPALDCGKLDLNALCPPSPARKDDLANAVCYLYRRIDSPNEMELPVTLGSDDGVRVWLNGTLLVDRHVGRALAVQDEFVTLKLRSGANHLFVKVTNLNGPYAFQIKPWTRVSQQAINEAIDRGVEFLIQRQLLDGSWGVWNEWGGGHAAFTAYTLLKCGVRSDHPAVRMALEYTRHRPMETTYASACLLMALEASGDASSRERMSEVLDQLVAIQANSGLFDYPIYPDGQRPPVDMSNTLYAALAMRAAHKAGLEVSDAVWSKLAGGALKCFERARTVTGVDGTKREIAGFSYRINEGVSGSMTSAGLSTLAICEEVAGDRLAPALRSRIAEARRLGMAWLAENMVWSVNPGQGAGHLYFWIYGLERVGALLAVDKIGDVEWYWSGADYLLKAQAADGSWNQGYVNHEYLDTLLALLFLKKATARGTGDAARVGVVETKEANADVALRVTGDTPLTMWPTNVSDALVQELGRPDGTLDIEKVEYVARYETGPEEYESLGGVAGSEAKRAELQRFALRHTFDRRGKWFVKVRLVVRPVSATGSASDARTLESPPLEVRIDGVIDPARLDYAADLGRNLLFGARAKFSASSQASDGEAPDKVADGNQGTRWRCSKDDASPKLQVTLERPLKADRVLLSQAEPRLSRAAAARVSRVRVVVNQTQTFEATLSDDVLEKTTIDFGAVVAVKELSISVLESRDRKLGTDPVGMAEVELEKRR